MSRNLIYRLKRNPFLAFLAVLGAVLIAFRIALPHIVRHYVNYKLDQLPDYDGQIRDVDIHLVRGAYTIHGIRVVKIAGRTPLPFFSVTNVQFSVDWNALLHGGLESKIWLDRPTLNFVASPSKEESQTSVSQSWLGIVEDLFPFTIDRVDLRNGTVRFVDRNSKPEIDLWVTNLMVVATNLTNSRMVSNTLKSGLKLRGTTIGDGQLGLEMHFDPMASTPAFDLNLALDGLNLPALNDFFRAYANVDLEGGTLRLFTEFVAREGRFRGYVKPLLDNFNMVELGEEKGVLHTVWEIIVSGFAHLFQNQAKDRLATKIPISGAIDNPNLGIWNTVVNLLRNAFVQAFSPRLDLTVGTEPPGGKPAAPQPAKTP